MDAVAHEAPRNDAVKNAAAALRAGKRPPGFAALVRAVEQEASSRNKPRIGFAKTPRDEAVRFGQKPALHFVGSELAEVVQNNGGSGSDLILTYFFGLLGINGPMPLEFTNYVLQRSRSHYDHTWRRFLDIIHHRFHTFYYRAFACNDQAASSDRAEDDGIKAIVASLAGQSREGADEDLAMAVGNALCFSFRLKNRANLEALLQNEYQLPVTVEDFVLSHNDIPAANHVYLGRHASSCLGVNMQIGRRFLSMTQKFEIRVGPMDYTQFCDFIMNPKGVARMAKAVQLFLDRPLDFDVLPLVQSEHIPGTCLGGVKIAGRAFGRLGMGCWLGRPKADTIVSSRISLERIMKMKNRGTKWQH